MQSTQTESQEAKRTQLSRVPEWDPPAQLLLVLVCCVKAAAATGAAAAFRAIHTSLGGEQPAAVATEVLGSAKRFHAVVFCSQEKLAGGRAGGAFQHHRPLAALPWSGGWGSVSPEEDEMGRKSRAILRAGSFIRKNSLLVRTQQCRLSRRDELRQRCAPPAGLPVQSGGCNRPLL